MEAQIDPTRNKHHDQQKDVMFFWPPENHYANVTQSSNSQKREIDIVKTVEGTKTCS